MRGRSRRGGSSVRGSRAARWLLAAGTLALGGALSVAAGASTPPAFAAEAAISPKLYYIGDTVSSVYTFTITNTGATSGIGAVEITRPADWGSVTSCPSGPTGWARTASTTKCRYRSAASTSDDLGPGQSKVFTLRAKTAPGTQNRTGTWPVVVSKSNHFDTPSSLKAASPTGAGLTTRAYLFELTTAVVSTLPVTPGTACPAENKSAVRGSTQTIVVCGKNRASAAFQPILSYSALGGTFIADRGTFASATIAKNSADVVLANWVGAEITSVFGPGKKVVAGIGASPGRTSPLRTFTGYSATSQPPTAVDDAYSTDEDTQLVKLAAAGVLANDTDTEGDPLTAAVVDDVDHGTLTLNADGSFTYDPDADFDGTDSFTYKANDMHSDSSAATVTITVSAVNDAPVATADPGTTDENTAKTVAVRGNDTDVDGDTLTVSSVDQTGTAGTVTITNAGTDVSYDPDGQFESLRPGQTATDTFTYTVSDGNGGDDTETVTMTITGVNDAPDAVDDARTTDEATGTGPISVLTNDSDDEGAVTITSVDTTGTAGLVTNNNDGTLSYSPGGAFEYLENGEDDTDTFTYTVTDLDGSTDTATVTVTVTGINDAPDAVNDAASVGENASATTVNVRGNDVDAESQTLTVDSVDQTGTTGTVAITNGGADVSYDPDGQFESLRPGETATDTFTYTVEDSQGATDTATVTVTITGVNDAPSAVDDTASTDEATATGPISVLTNDSDDEGAVTITGVDTTGTAGLVTNNNDGTLTYNPGGAFESLENGEDDTDTFTYTVTDLDGGTDTATVTITVNGINDAPVAADDAPAVTEDASATTVNVLGNDTDVEGQTLTVTAVDQTGTTGVVAITNAGADVSYDPNGMFEYLDAGETATDSFTYTTEDTQGGQDTATVTITVTGVEDAPVAVDDAYGAIEDTPLVVAAPGVLTNDTDSDDVLTAGNASNPPNGSVTLNADGSFTYTPDSGFLGEDTFTYDASDGTSTGSATVTITVVSPNATPVANATSASGDEDGGAITVTLTGTDADDDNLTFDVGTATNGLVTEPVPGSIDCTTTAKTCTTTVTYTPGANFAGSDSFTYTVNDGTIDSAAATASITVAPINDEPSFTKGANQTVLEDAAPPTVTGWATGVSAGPANESGQALTFIATTSDDALFSALPAINSGGDLSFTPAVNANGVATVTVKLKDDGGTANAGDDDESPTQQFTITVTAVNDEPSFTKGADQTLNEDAGAQSVSNWATAISKGPADESAQTVSFTTSNDNNGLFSVQPGVSPTGTLVYTAAPDAVGIATVSIYLSDTGGTANNGDDTSPTQTFTITVNGVNDQPSFTDDGDQAVLEDAGAQTVNGFVNSTSAGPADESGQTVTVAVTDVTNPTLFSAAPTITNGVLTYTPAANANGVSTVTAVATDNGGTANGGDDTGASETFTITVTAVNDAPSFTKGADQTLDEDAGAQSVSNWATAISKGPADESAQTLSFTVTNDNNDLFASQPAVSSNGTLTYTSTANKYGTATVSVSISDNGGTANGGDDTSDVQTFVVTVNAVNDAPVAAPQAFTVQANMKISLGGLLTGATDPNDVNGGSTATPPVTHTPSFTLGSITAGAGCVGCTISNIDNAAGTFDFDPPAGGTGTYTVTYTVVDNGHPTPGVASAAQTITFTVSGPVIWFVDAAAAPGGTGRLSAPFTTLAAASAVDLANQRIFAASGTYTDALTLLNGEWLAGTGSAATSFDTLMGITPPPGTVARPSINGTRPVLQGTVALGSGNTVRGVTLSGSPGLTGTSFGTLTTGAGASADTAFSTAGGALSLTTGTIAGDFVSTSSSGGANNVLLSGVSSTGTSLGTGALSGATAEGFKVVGGTGTFGYSGTVANAAGTTVSIADKTGGTVTLSGAVSDTAGAGVSLSNNGGSTIAFTGGVTLTSGTSPAFAATGGGTVTVTGTANTLTSTTGTALNIASTTIGAADVTFRSIASNGAAKGIVLDTTGNVGNLVVTGNGGTCTIASTAGCSGGTIASSAGGDDSGTSPVGTGIVLNNTTAPSFTRMRINGSTNHGIRGNAVNGVTLDSVVVDGTHGSNASSPFNDGGVRFTGLTGTATFTALEVTGGHSDNVAIVNSSGTLNATFSSPRLGANSTTDGNDGLIVDGSGTATVNVTVQNGTFTASRGDQFQYVNNGSGGGSLTFTGNTLTNSHPAIATGGGGVTIQAGEKGPVTMNIASNTLTGAVGNAWTIVKSDDGTAGNASGSITGTFNANTVGNAGVADSGSSEGSGLLVTHQGDGANVWTITNNQIRQYNNYGIHVKSGDGAVRAGTNTANISGNTLANPGTNAAISNIFQGIHINSGVTAGDTFVTCANFGANSINGSGRNGGTDFRVQHRQSTTVRLPGYAGGQYDLTAAGNFVRAQITGSPTGSATTSSTGGGFSGAAC